MCKVNVEEGAWRNVCCDNRLRIRPRFMRDVSHRDQSTTVLGTEVMMPVGVAPTAMQRMAHPDGECANARGEHFYRLNRIFFLICKCLARSPLKIKQL
jgi:isopentenyl diphosphate isomerase/L-lactate dehydrogenase-like FMN-dependent dehydrogenase